MSMPSSVNPQISDAVTQASSQIPGGALAISLSQLYQGAAQALVNAAHNAVSSQQQSNVLMQAATTQAVMQLLSMDSADNATPPDENKASALPQTLAATTSPDALAHIEQAIESANKHGLDNAGSWSHAARDIMNTVAGALRELQKVSQETGMAMVKQAAIAAVLVHMIKAPDHLEQYQKILGLIEGL
ncbi:Killing trait domain-containing protein [Dyella sp. OK004]|uniref:RebB family R body protein n=1 Tax=Dyella sp. OK004 TaxID=1855292 RepID=UPI0008F1B35F|nr:RebB family R body protein [Dyella sp. OK004]SFR86886.1 Killing trait domain-containing protein [Dyella sp. OK004]